MTVGIVPLTEAQFQKQVQDLAELNQWAWMHIDKMGNRQGQWYTPAFGPLSVGFADLMLLSKRTGKIIFIELKAQRGVVSDRQRMFRQLVGADRYYLFRPSDFAQVVEVLANGH